MSLFGKRRKAEPAAAGKSPEAGPVQTAETPLDAAVDPGVKILGSGCAKCYALEAAAREALARLGMDTAVDHVTDFSKIAAYGVMTTPALVVDGRVLCCGRAPGAAEVARLIEKARGK